MSLYPSGKGWSADDSFMISSTGAIGTISLNKINGVNAPEVPVVDPAVANREYVWEHGLAISIPRWEDPSAMTYWKYVVMADRPGCIVSGYPTNIISILVPSNDTQIYVTEKASAESAGNYGTAILFQYNVNNVRYWRTTYQATPTSIIPMFPSEQDYKDALSQVSQPFYKMFSLDGGYACGAFVKWKYGTATYLSPILISSVYNNAVISLDGTSLAPSEIHNNHLWDGMRFSMHYFTDYPYGAVSNNRLPYRDISDRTFYDSDDLFRAVARLVSLTVTDSPDPYDDTAEEEGGDGTDPEDDPVEEQTNPLPSVAGLGFCSVYVPSESELLQMSAYLWSGNFDPDLVIKLFSNPLDSIIGLSAVPVDLVGTSEQIYLGGVALTGVTMPRYTGRTAVKVDMGTSTISERYGAYLDYDPYTEFAIYVPFVGIKTLKADDVMGKTLSLMYDIDILTGACVAYLRPAGGSVLYEWAGQCAQQIPVTASNWDNIFRNAMTAATTLGTSLLAPASAPVLAGAVASAATQAIAAKPRVDRSGALTGVSGWLGQLRPYIIRTIPEAYIPADQNKFIGYPAYINVTMSEISGYNEVASVHLEGIPATGNELAEIESLLKGGVIF